jgi:Arc/MetJ-type ribon-helix-helix transcriptional regulator
VLQKAHKFTKTITVRITQEQADSIDAVIASGIQYTKVGEFVRAAIADKLAKGIVKRRMK